MDKPTLVERLRYAQYGEEGYFQHRLDAADRIEELESDIKRIQESHIDCTKRCAKVIKQRDELEAENKRLKELADAVREIAELNEDSHGLDVATNTWHIAKKAITKLEQDNE